jgi:phosphoglycolate phosphatase
VTAAGRTMTASLPEAVVFDLDGTLVDSVPDIAAALGALMAEHGLEPQSRPAVERMVGHGVANLVARAFAAHGRTFVGEALDQAVERYMALYEPRATWETRLYPGVAETVAELAEAGVRMAVCTNKPGAVSRRIVEALGLGGTIGIVVGGDAGPARKPAPDLLLHAVSLIGVQPARAVLVGDSGADVASARAAGMPVIVVDYGYSAVAPSDLGADRVIGNFAELPGALAVLAGAEPWPL